MPPVRTTSRRELDPQLRSRLCELRAIGWGFVQIHARYPHIPLSTIKTTIYREPTRSNNVSRPRSGQPRRLTEEYRDRIWDKIETEPHTKENNLLSEVDYVVRKRSIQRLLNEMGRRKWVQQNVPELKPEHAVKRLEGLDAMLALHLRIGHGLSLVMKL